MAFDTKPDLTDDKFEQFSGQILSLSGTTDIFGTINSYSGYNVCGEKIIDVGEGNCSITLGTQLVADGNCSISIGNANSSCGSGTVIIGGYNNEICNTVTNTVLLGINNQTITGTTYDNYTIVCGLALFNTPDGTGDLLSWDSTTKKICLSEVNACNGLTKSGNNICLGGTLTNDVFITINNSDGINFCGTKTCYQFYDSYYQTLLECNDNCFNIEAIPDNDPRYSYWASSVYRSSPYSGSSVGVTPIKSYLWHCSGSDESCLVVCHELQKSIINNCDILCITSSGLKYNYDHSTSNVGNPRWIPDAEWVTGQTGAISAANGLTREGSNIVLGGALTGDTTISGSQNQLLINNTLQSQIHAGTSSTTHGSTIKLNHDSAQLISFTGGTTCLSGIYVYHQDGVDLIARESLSNNYSCIGLRHGDIFVYNCNGIMQYSADYSSLGASNPRWIPDAEWVTGQTSGGGTITGGINGLSTSGTNIILGGNLTGFTSIDSCNIYFGYYEPMTGFGVCTTGNSSPIEFNTCDISTTGRGTLCISTSQVTIGSFCLPQRAEFDVRFDNGIVIYLTGTSQSYMRYQYDNSVQGASNPRWIPDVGWVTGNTGNVCWFGGNVGSNNYIITANGDGTIVAESGIIYDGTSLKINGDIQFSGETEIKPINSVSTGYDLYLKSGSGTTGGDLYLIGGDGSISAGGDVLIRGGIRGGISTCGGICIGDSTTSAVYLGTTSNIPVGTPDGSEYLFVDTSDGNRIKRATIDGVTGGTNGLGLIGNNICLGGELTNSTTIYSDGSTYDLTIGTLTCEINFYTCSPEFKLGYCVGGYIYGDYCCTLIKSCFDATAFSEIGLDHGEGIKITLEGMQCGLYYNEDYSSCYSSNPRWIPDAEWVTGQTSGGINYTGTVYANGIVTAVNSSTVCAENCAKYDGATLQLWGSGTRLTLNPAGSTASIYNYDGVSTMCDIRIGSSFANNAIFWDDSENKVGINNDTPSYTLDVNGDISSDNNYVINGFYKCDGSNGIYAVHPSGGKLGQTSSQLTGYLKISLPTQCWTSSMSSFYVDIFEYRNRETYSILIGGYDYKSTGANRWVNSSATIITNNPNKDLSVRFSSGSTTPYVLIGESSTVWCYLQVSIRDAQHGFSNGCNVCWYKDWDISVTPTISDGDITIRLNNNLPAAGTLCVTSSSTYYPRIGDSACLRFGDSSDFIIQHDGSNACLCNTTGNIEINSDINIYGTTVVYGALCSNAIVYGDVCLCSAGGIMVWNDATFGNDACLRDETVVIQANHQYVAKLEVRGAPSTQGTGIVYVGQDVAYGGGMGYAGDTTPTSIFTQDNISFFRSCNNTCYEVFRYQYNCNDVYFNGNICGLTCVRSPILYGTTCVCAPFVCTTSGNYIDGIYTNASSEGYLNVNRYSTCIFAGYQIYYSPTGIWGMVADETSFYICDVANSKYALRAAENSSTYLYYNNAIKLCTITNGICAIGCGCATDWIASSDARLKKNIVPINNALSTISKLCGVCYNWCENDEMDMGLIAQHVEAIEPILVTHGKPDEDKIEKYGIDDGDLRGLKYDKISAILIEAIKEQQEEINKLKEEINKLKDK